MAEVRFRVSSQQGGERLDKLVAEAAGVSRRIARTFIASGRVRVAGRVVRILTRPIRAGAEVLVAPGEAKPAVTERRDGGAHEQPTIVYCDRHLLVVDKPAGLLSERDRFGSPSLEDLAPAILRQRGERDEVWLVHRLDAGTSGVMLLARSKAASATLGAAFRDGEVDKTYLAICRGRLGTAQTIDAPIARGERTRHVVNPAGKPARTVVAPLAEAASATLVRALPATGRTHQIRVHLAHLGHPLYGDRLYGGPMYTDEVPPIAVGRPMLHARAVEVRHPKTGERLRFAAPPPEDFQELARRLGLLNEDRRWDDV
jgi:RluA family pseudouridine synthase